MIEYVILVAERKYAAVGVARIVRGRFWPVVDFEKAYVAVGNKLTPLTLSNLIDHQAVEPLKNAINNAAAKTGFALNRLQRPVFIAARFYRLFYSPLPPCFSFSERLRLARFLAQVNGRKIVA